MRYLNLLVVFIALTSPFVGAQPLHKYQHHIHNAELMLMAGKFSPALQQYDSAFSFACCPFAVDIYNAMKCASISRDYEKVSLMALRLVNLGCEINFFEKSTFLIGYRQSNLWPGFVKAYSKSREQFVKRNNWALRRDIALLEAMDQYQRVKDYRNTDSIYMQDDKNKKVLVELLRDSFPNEYDYGVFIEHDTTLIPFHPLTLTILHNYGKYTPEMIQGYNKNNVDLTAVLEKAVGKMELPPENFAQLNDVSGLYKKGKGYGQDGILTKIGKKVYYNKWDNGTLVSINTNRAQIGLGPIALEVKKLLYESFTNPHGFILHKSWFTISSYDLAFSEPMIHKVFQYSGFETK